MARSAVVNINPMAAFFVAAAQELAFQPKRLEKLPAQVLLLGWGEARGRAIQRRDPYMVLGRLVRPDGRPKVPASIHQWIQANYQVAAQFGRTPTYPGPGWFRGNEETIYVLKRVPLTGGAVGTGEEDPRGVIRKRIAADRTAG
ncbi:MAG TPA: hypothetical protein VGH73_23900 [Thermoanaerobaculia bacterium]